MKLVIRLGHLLPGFWKKETVIKYYLENYTKLQNVGSI